jgi:hypothetical protein
MNSNNNNSNNCNISKQLQHRKQLQHHQELQEQQQSYSGIICKSSKISNSKNSSKAVRAATETSA